MKEKPQTNPQKAWKIDFKQIESGWEYSERVVYADTRNQAKTLLLKNAWDMGLKNTGYEITYLNIPVIRYKQSDKIWFEGGYFTKNKIEQKKYDRQRNLELDNILSDKTITHCYIRKGSYYRPNASGYTDMLHRAGVFTKLDAVISAKSCHELRIIPINITEHNKLIQTEINELQTRIL